MANNQSIEASHFFICSFHNALTLYGAMMSTSFKHASRMFRARCFSYQNTPSNQRAFVAEFVATTLFVYVGCGTVVASQALLALNPEDDTRNNNAFLLSVAMAFGFGISVLVFVTSPLSGGHLNPAVTCSFALLGHIHPVLALWYLVAQMVGAVLGAGLVYGTFSSTQLQYLSGATPTPPFLLGMNSVTPGISLGSAFLGETMGTLLLVFTVLMTAAYQHNTAANLAPIAIGWSVFLAHLVLVPITGCGINPARTFGPMVVNLFSVGQSISYNGWWIYYVAPLVGSLIASLISKHLFGVLNKREEGIFGLDPSAEEEIIELREAEPMMTTNILTEMDKEKCDEEDASSTMAAEEGLDHEHEQEELTEFNKHGGTW